MSDASQKLDILLSKHTKWRPDMAQKLEVWEKQLREAIQTEKFGEHKIIKRVRMGYATELQEINALLLYKEDLSVEDRQRLFDKRYLCLRFLNLFSEAQYTIETIDQAISFELGLDNQK